MLVPAERSALERLLAEAASETHPPGRRWRRRRDVVIWVAHREGLSLRTLAGVFDLSASRVHAIVGAVERWLTEESSS